jgi:hypothetical protein
MFEPVVAHEDGIGLSAPLPHQGRAGLQHSAGIERTSASLELEALMRMSEGLSWAEWLGAMSPEERAAAIAGMTDEQTEELRLEGVF